MLELRPDCERCGRLLPADESGAHVCSFECTFCSPCVWGALAGRCPNCGGELVPRPRREGDALARHPASTRKRHRAGTRTAATRRADATEDPPC